MGPGKTNEVKRIINKNNIIIFNEENERPQVANNTNQYQAPAHKKHQ
jgi:U3 small nucleolar ribonucleoprotein component